MNNNLMMLVLVCCIGLVSACSSEKASNETTTVIKQLSVADVVQIQPQNFEQTIAFTGSLRPLQEAIVSAESGGTVAKMLVAEGDEVQKEQVVAVMDNQAVSQNVQSLQAQVDNSRANLALSNTKLKQQQVLFEKGFVSKLALEQAQNEYQVALGNHKVQQAELAKMNKNQADASVKAPITGVVYEKLVNAGELLPAGGQILKLAQVSVLEIAATVSSEQVAFVRVGQEVSFSVAVGAPSHTGRIVRINPVADAATRQFTVFIHVNNPEGVLKVGQFAQGKVVLQSLDNALVIPQLAVRNLEQAPFVYVVENGVLAQKNIKIVLQDTTSGLLAIDGLSAGANVLRTELLGVKVGDAVALPKAGK
ncbi:efflux RND transporter periplasmic adaptor subunit [Vitreoscilla sp. C1]|uniref:efflux RND transporter periplasmic adaptor subunit n=1 Tax=Vitreoscilla sp. (strain C1) TaxID=96942 RepID=UPI000CDC83C5|nr:efflux RND transporter periplasmic adaptor subunit [Vitreoscilla sp. C1]